MRPHEGSSTRQRGRSKGAVAATQPHSLGLALLSAQGVNHLSRRRRRARCACSSSRTAAVFLLAHLLQGCVVAAQPHSLGLALLSAQAAGTLCMQFELDGRGSLDVFPDEARRHRL